MSTEKVFTVRREVTADDRASRGEKLALDQTIERLALQARRHIVEQLADLDASEGYVLELSLVTDGEG